MKHTSRWMLTPLSLVLATGLTAGHAAEKKEREQQQQQQQQQRQNQGQGRGNQGQGQGQGQGRGGGIPGNPGNRDIENQGQGNRGFGNARREIPGNPDRQPGLNRNPGRPGDPEKHPGEDKPDKQNPKQPQPEVRRSEPKQPNTEKTLPLRNQRESVPRNPPAPVRPPMKEVKNTNGDIEQRSADGRLRGVTKQDLKTGETRSQQFSTTGRVEREQVVRADGSSQTRELDLGNRERRVTVVHADKRETTDVHYDRTGAVRSRETVVVNNKNVAVSKTVVVKQNFVVKNTTVVNVHSTRYYAPCRWGYVYRPVFIAPAVYVGWYDPFWYGPVHHHFTFSWGWEVHPWYRYHAYYWEPYPVYAGPSYWVTDWMVAGYIADRYAVATSIEQTREEVRLAKEEAEKARNAAEQARDAAEIAEAKAAQAQAEARAERAEARIVKAQAEEERRKALADKPNPNATPITKETKEQLRDQVEQTIAEKKSMADKGENAVSPDVTQVLKDPKHVYPVSKNLSVSRAEDSKPAGTLTPGDLLKIEPGQESALKNATESTLLQMRVITSKGEDDSVPAGTVIVVPLKELQEFDNEFRAKIDLGLAEADKNKDEFKKSAAAQ